MKSNSFNDVPRTESGEALGVIGIENACVAKCAWFLDGHISAIREHYERKIQKLEKELYDCRNSVDSLDAAYVNDTRLVEASACIKSVLEELNRAEAGNSWESVRKCKKIVRNYLKK